jgi:hypothetical protein
MQMYINFHKGQRKILIEIVLNGIVNDCCSHYPNKYFNEDLVHADSLRNEEKFITELQI